MADESEMQLSIAQTLGFVERKGLGDVFMVVALPSISGLRIPSTGCAMEQGNANKAKAFYLVLLFCYRIEPPHPFNLIYLTISRA